MKHLTRTFVAVLLTGLGCALAGCPRFAYVLVFNHSDHEVRLSVNGEDRGLIAKGSTLKARFDGYTLEILHGTDRWIYDREIPHRGENGPFFDGTLRLQLESNGFLYALKKDDVPPVESHSEQPPGFPLKPKT